MYPTLRPTEVKRELLYVSTLVHYEDHTVPVLDDIIRNIVTPQFHVERSDNGGDDHPSREKSDDGQSSRSGLNGPDDHDGSLASDCDDLSAEDSGDENGDGSTDDDNDSKHTRGGHVFHEHH